MRVTVQSSALVYRGIDSSKKQVFQACVSMGVQDVTVLVTVVFFQFKRIYVCAGCSTNRVSHCFRGCGG